MRKAFDANVPKLKPRLRPAMVVVSDSVQVEQEEKLEEKQEERTNFIIEQPVSETVIAAADDISDLEPAITSERISDVNVSAASVKEEISKMAEIVQASTAENQIQLSESLNVMVNSTQTVISEVASNQLTKSTSAASVLAVDDSETRRQRLENVKRKVTEAVRPEVQIEPVPEDPALAVESVLGLVSDLETQLSQSRELEKSLRAELAEAKAELARTVNDGRSSSGRLAQAEAQLVEKRKVLEEMLFEMGALEQERDQAVRMVQVLTGKDQGRQLEFDELRNHCDEMQCALDESKAEEERLNNELDEYITENTRLHALMAEMTRERDSLTRNAEKLTKERDELAQAKKALEKVHQALSQARARLRE
jgi:DNA repair exonuclease SbcCD ATPase subunit